MSTRDTKKNLKDHEMLLMFEVMAHGRPFTPEQIWYWLEPEDLESLRICELSMTGVMLTLDSLQRHSNTLNPSHKIPFPNEFELTRKSVPLLDDIDQENYNQNLT